MRISRRTLLGTAGIAAVGTGVGAWWWHAGDRSVAEADEAAAGERALFDRGLIPVERSGWTMPEGVHPAWPQLAADVEANVLVVGAGLAGASLALHLSEAGVSVVVLEARQPGWGASGRNAGHVLPTLRDPRVFDRFPDRGKRFLASFGEHRSITFDLAKKHELACDAKQTGYLNAAAGTEAILGFRQKTRWMEERGLLQVAELGGDELFRSTGTTNWDRGLVYTEGGHVNPYRFTNGMIDAAARFGAKVFGNSEARNIAPTAGRWRIMTENGSVTADRVVFCTNAYATDIVPEFARAFYPLTAYALTTKPLPKEAQSLIMPSGMVLSQAPLDLNPLVRDEHQRLILSSIPTVATPEDAMWHFKSQLDWVNGVWPETRNIGIELEAYWTGRVALRDEEFPGVFEVHRGLYGLMYFNAWGNLMAPLMGKLFARGLASDLPDEMPFPVEKPVAVDNIGKQDRIIRHLLLPAARQGQRFGLL